MGLNIGIDFGTATTCVGVIEEATNLPVVLPLEGGAPFVDSLVWFDNDPGAPALLGLTGDRRAPKAVCQEAQRRFDSYWAARIRAQSEHSTWARWLSEEKESGMLLSYFKPELADERRYTERVIERVQSGRWDPMAEYQETGSYTSMVWVADPAPDSDDYVTATACLLDMAARAAVERWNQKIDVLMLGVPALDADVDAQEANRGREQRERAIELAGIGHKYGSSRFRFDFRSEALAAGAGIAIEDNGSNPMVLVIDVGAGTTDLGIVHYRRGRHGRFTPVDELTRKSLRLAGRDINAAIANELCARPELRQLDDVMDKRAWQLLLDIGIESIKRGLAFEEKQFALRLFDFAAHPGDIEWGRDRQSLLNRAYHFWLSYEGMALPKFIPPWGQAITAFLGSVEASCPEALDHLVSVELVGGACRFAPLRAAAEAAIRDSPFRDVPVRFQDTATNNAQTVVARGLANEALS